MKLVSNFNKRFKEAFGDRNLTEFANSIGVSKQTISAYINGKRKPKAIVSAEIAKKLNVSPAWLLGFDVPKELETNATFEIPENDKLTAEFVTLYSLFSQLSTEQQKMIIAQIKGILADK